MKRRILLELCLLFLATKFQGDRLFVTNEYRSAGKYITKFNGSNMASGVYFARILVNDGKDFIAVRKLVLIK